MKNKLRTGLKTIIFMCVSTFVLLLLVSGIYYKFHIDNTKIMAGVVGIYFLSTFVGGFIYGKIKEKNKYLYGILIGIIYFAVLLTVSMLCRHGVKMNDSNVIYALLSCIFGGMLGGMLG